MSEQHEPALYSPMSATTAAVRLWEAIDVMLPAKQRMLRTSLVASLTEVCYVINSLAMLAKCPGNTSVDDFKLQRVHDETT